MTPAQGAVAPGEPFSRQHFPGVEPGSLAERLCWYRLWVAAGRAKIKDERGKIVTLVLNDHQQDVLQAMFRQAMENRPVKVIVLKNRKRGCSTFVQTLFYFLTKYTAHWTAITLAHTGDSTSEIFQITRRVLRNDPDAPEVMKSDNQREIAFDPERRFRTETAGASYAGSGANYNALHIAELAKCDGIGMPVSDFLASIQQSVPDDPNTIQIIESTANRLDSSREFQKRFEAAYAGQSDFVAVFGQWFTKHSADLDRVPKEHVDVICAMPYYAKHIADGLFEARHAVWHWKKCVTDYGADLELMLQDYPSTVEEAFRQAEGLIFPMLRLDRHGKSFEDMDPAYAAGFVQRYRGVDWGGVHPFACVWLAFRPGKLGFTVDARACPNTWKQLTGWAWDEATGMAGKKEDDTIDAIRYVITYWRGGPGHWHVYRELFLRASAAQGFSHTNLADKIIEMSAGEDFEGTVCDPNQGTAIVDFTQKGIDAFPYEIVDAAGKRAPKHGSIADGIMQMRSFMNADAELFAPEATLPDWERLRRLRAETPVDFSVSDDMVILAEGRARRREAMLLAHPELGGCY